MARENHTAAATAAATAADAAIALATSTANTAKALADAKTASDIALAVMGNDISHIKSDILEIKGLFLQVSTQYATKEAVQETVTTSTEVHEDHETRIRVLERVMWKWIGFSAAGTAVATIVVTVFLKVAFNV